MRRTDRQTDPCIPMQDTLFFSWYYYLHQLNAMKSLFYYTTFRYMEYYNEYGTGSRTNKFINVTNATYSKLRYFEIKAIRLILTMEFIV